MNMKTYKTGIPNRFIGTDRQTFLRNGKRSISAYLERISTNPNRSPVNPLSHQINASIPKRRFMTSPAHIAVIAVQLVAFELTLPVKAQSPSVDRQPNIRVVAESPYAVARRDGNQRLWLKTTWESNSTTGKVTTKTNSYVELTTGSAHLVNGQWIDSNDQIEITRTGARAINAPHKVEFLGNINSEGAIRITLPEGDKHLVSNPIGLSYFDTASGKSVLIAEIKDSIGQLLPSGNQVLYPDAFTDISADALYINSISGFEQLIVLRKQLPSPAEWGLDPATTLLQVITEFINPPAPKIIEHNADGVPDQYLDFGVTQMPKGYAFALGDEANTIPVTKQWLILDKRHCLVESTPFSRLASLLQNLPSPSGQAALKRGADSLIGKVFQGRVFPARNTNETKSQSLQLAGLNSSSPGVAIDYATATSQTNFTFQGDTTYFVSSNVTLSGTTTLEGGAVIKFTNNPNAKLSISAAGSLVFKTAPYRPAILTSMDDNTVGESIPGSTGSPTNFNGATYLSGPDTNTTYQYLRFSYAGTAIEAYTPHEVSHCQFFRCSTAISGTDNAALKLRNVLFSSCGTLVSIGSGDTVAGEHLTIDQATTLFHSSLSTKLTNSIITGVTNIGTNVTLYFCTTNASGNGIYQTVGAGGFYLADGSTNRNIGTTNIHTNLLASIKTKTTYPPVHWTTDFTTNVTFTTQATRDTDTPDLGYHYEPIDYVVSGRTLTNATLTLTNGVALGTYGPSSTYGVAIRKGGNLVSGGSATGLNQIVRYNTVQEQVNTNWSSSTVAHSVMALLGSPTPPKGTFRFTSWSLLGGRGYHFHGDYPSVTTPFGFKDCQFSPGTLHAYQCSAAFTNCIFDRATLELDDDGDTYDYYAYNNLFRFGNLTFGKYGSGSWIAKDNFFDASSISQSPNSITHSNNAYVSGYNRLTPTNVNDVVLTNIPAFLTSHLGNYYYPTNDGMLSLLINAGSRNSTNASLYHYSTTTNQVKEGSSSVDIGFHYVATGTNGIPVNTDGDSYADYLEDTNGNGAVDGGESDWTAP